MYHDPALIRKHVIKVSLSDREAKLIEALPEYTGEQKAAMVRGLVMDRLFPTCVGMNRRLVGFRHR